MQQEWMRRAELAVQKGDDELAREALKRKKSYQVRGMDRPTQCYERMHRAVIWRQRLGVVVQSQGVSAIGRFLSGYSSLPYWHCQGVKFGGLHLGCLGCATRDLYEHVLSAGLAEGPLVNGASLSLWCFLPFRDDAHLNAPRYPFTA